MTTAKARKSASEPISTTYLDYNAAVPIRPQAKAAALAAIDQVGNPASIHAPGRAARALLEHARQQVGNLVNAAADSVIFTSGGTEAMTLALSGAKAGVCLLSSIEHVCALAAVPDAELIPVSAQGVVELEWLEERLAAKPRPTMVAVMFANNETGVLQPITDVVALCRAHGVATVCDAAQVPGKVAVDFRALDVDALALSAHKIGGLPGCGALVVKRPDSLLPLIPGGGQERGRRGGSHNLPGIVAFGAAALATAQHLDQERERCRALGVTLETTLRTVVPSITIWGERAPRVSNTLCVRLPGVPNRRQLMALDLAGVAISTGSACSSGTVGPSHVLMAMGASSQEASESIRVSWGWATDGADVEAFVAAWKPLACAADMQGMAQNHSCG